MVVEFLNQLITPLVLLAFVIGFATVWFQFRELKSAGIFALSYSVAVLAFVLEFVLSKTGNVEISVLRLVTDTLYMVSVALSVTGIACRYGKKVPIKWLLSIGVIATACNVFLYLGMPDAISKAYIISSACSFMMFMALPLIRDAKSNPVDNALYWLVAFSAFQLMLNAALIVFLDKNLITWNMIPYEGFIAILNFTVVVISLSIALCLMISYGHEIIQKLQVKSSIDGMTGLLNRSAFEAETLAEISRCQKNGLPVSLIVTDIDLFKKVNDTYGHDSGDVVIRNFASLIKSACRVNDLVGRVGGEEFCVLLPTANEEMASITAQNIRTSLEEMVHKTGADVTLQVTASFGVAQMMANETYTSLFKRADLALYEAKSSGRNQVIISTGEQPITSDMPSVSS